MTSHELWLHEQMRRYTYRPGTVLSIDTHHAIDHGFAHYVYNLKVQYEAPDSRRPGQVRTITARFWIPDRVIEDENAARFARWMSETMIDVEAHESREWLRLDGQLVSDPHDHARKDAG